MTPWSPSLVSAMEPGHRWVAPMIAIFIVESLVTRVFVDTSGWYALVDAKDPDHGPVVESVRTHRDRLLTSNYVFDETLTLVRYQLGWQIAHRLGERLRDGRLTRVERVTPRDEEAA